MKTNDIGRGEVILYRAEGKDIVEVRLENETVWLNTHQMAELFGVDRTGIVRHIRNVYESGELDRGGTCAKIAQVAKDGKTRQMDFYNLDVIISVGYRINSKKGTKFRIWASDVLRQYIVKGYSVNRKRLEEKGFEEFEHTIRLLKGAAQAKQLTEEEKTGLLKLITDYAQSWLLLHKFDTDNMPEPEYPKRSVHTLDYNTAKQAALQLKKNLIRKGQADDMFGVEREKLLQEMLIRLNMVKGDKELYPTAEKMAAHLFYYIIKDKPFTDGNKRIAALLFILFLLHNHCLLKPGGEHKVGDTALVALALLAEQSSAKDKDAVIGLIMNIIGE